MNSTNSSQRGNWPTLPDLSAILLVFMLFLPDLDIFAQTFAAAPTLFEWLLGVAPYSVLNTFIKITVIALSGLTLVNFGASAKEPVLRTLIVTSLGMAAYGLLRLFLAGTSFQEMTTNSSMIGIFLIATSAIITSRYALRPYMIRNIWLGLLGVASFRLVIAGVSYWRFGGAQILIGVQSLALDGGLLVLWSFVAATAALFGIDALARRKYNWLFICVVIAAVFSAACVFSFRRTVQIWLLIQVAVGIIVYFWMRKKVLVGVGVVAAVSAATALMFFGLAVYKFGFHDANERLLSLSANSETEYGASNNTYKDDWEAWPTILAKSNFAGVGPGRDYGVPRLHELEVVNEANGSEGILPLHIGMFELWASYGPVGVVFHLLTVLILPIRCLVKCKNSTPETAMAISSCFGYVIFVALWPFAPPINLNFQPSILLGACLGLIIAESTKYGQVTATVRRVRSVEAIA